MKHVDEERTQGRQACADDPEAQLNQRPDEPINVGPGLVDE